MLDVRGRSSLDGATSLRDIVNWIIDEAWIPSSVHIFNNAGPELDLYEFSDAYVVELTAPGLRPQDIELHVQQNVLTIAGRPGEEKREQVSYLVRERASGSFKRSVTFPEPIDTDAVEALLEHGILRVRVPKAKSARAQTIKVRKV
ncbi:MAG: hypothetical protein KatS3mg057_0189 [Herpetosiphonaceae bacterium]|nr:MAG: hypothetical protein KatS3mg057_0189 [Herpetosiphonaceae bacterium]